MQDRFLIKTKMILPSLYINSRLPHKTSIIAKNVMIYWHILQYNNWQSHQLAASEYKFC